MTGHPGLGNLSLSFTDATGHIYDSVVLAGANGTGKSTILDAIQRTFEGAMGHQIGLIELQLELTAQEMAALPVSRYGGTPPSSPTVSYVVDTTISADWTGHNLSYVDGNGNVKTLQIVPPSEPWRNFFASFYSEVAINFSPGGIQGAGATALDAVDRKSARSGESISTQIAQLIVDIRAADAEDLAEWTSSNPGSAPPQSVQDKRFSRFRQAFEYMLPNKKFKRINRDNGSTSIEFEEFGRVSSIDKLSTGEKQIIFRAGFLLRDLANVGSAIVLVDEPELSLHPEWQERIVPFYKTILSDKDGNHPQIFIATHSPFIVHGAANSKIVILEKDARGNVRESPRPYYPSPGGSEAVRAFNISSFLSTSYQPMLLLTEGESDAEILRTAWSKLRTTKPVFFEARPALGDKNLQITLNDEETLRKAGGRLIVGMFDFDTAFNQWNGCWKSKGNLVSSVDSDGLVKKHQSYKAWAMLLPVPPTRSGFASSTLKGNSILSIEFLFDDAFIPPAMIDYKQVALGGQLPKIKDSAKSAFSTRVQSLPASAFTNFDPLLTRLEDIFAGQL